MLRDRGLRVPVKVCGLTREADALLAHALGASALGLVFHPPSPRWVTPRRASELRRALPADAYLVGVFVDRDPEEVNAIAEAVGLDAVQLHGRETPTACARIRRPLIKALHPGDDPAEYPAQLFLLDAAHPTLAGGTGRLADWDLAARLASGHPLLLAGGLGPANVLAALQAVHPTALDVNSGVEEAPGLKDPRLLSALFQTLLTAQGNRHDPA
jgi:phosphoribosylanthranilate isomerase